MGLKGAGWLREYVMSDLRNVVVSVVKLTDLGVANAVALEGKMHVRSGKCDQRLLDCRSGII